MATENQIKNVIKKQLSDFDQNGIQIVDETVIDTVFANESEITKDNPRIFKGNILWTLNKNKHVPKSGGSNKFPSGWRNLTVAGLASKLAMLLFAILIGISAQSQLKVNIGAVKTDLRQNALNFAFSYIHDLDSLYGGQDLMINGKSGYFLVTPDVDFKTGTQDAFSSITAKATGLFTHFRTTTVDGLVTPDASKTMQVFPVSVGMETNNQFSFINTLAEVGYEPYYQSPNNKAPEWIRHTKFGLYLQGGYKFGTGQDSSKKGGLADQSKETLNSSILRAKGLFLIDTKRLINISGLGIGVVGNSTLWYDVLHSAVYYKVEGIARVYLTDQSYFDLNYSKGSGAPNFNKGDQFGLGLTVQF